MPIPYSLLLFSRGQSLSSADCVAASLCTNYKRAPARLPSCLPLSWVPPFFLLLWLLFAGYYYDYVDAAGHRKRGDDRVKRIERKERKLVRVGIIEGRRVEERGWSLETSTNSWFGSLSLSQYLFCCLWVREIESCCQLEPMLKCIRLFWWGSVQPERISPKR